MIQNARVANAEDPMAWRWNDKPEWDGMRFTCKISLSESQPENGNLSFDYEIGSRDVGGTHFYNHFLDNKVVYNNFDILVFDQEHNWRNETHSGIGGVKLNPPDVQDFVYLRYGSKLSYQHVLKINQPPAHGKSMRLDPGRYYLQVAFSSMTTAQPPSLFTKSDIWPDFLRKMREHNWKRDYIRSNVIEFEVKESSE